MGPIISINTINLVSSIQTITDIFAAQTKLFIVISIEENGVKLQLIKENQIYRQMTIYGQNKGHFKFVEFYTDN